ncbi:hypothetical protein BGZ49_010204 [Haplosporangium sp. Z 27]|nr:hypothetical protein BGZ49_010204 [Haplosporangium sp. Z 27]
MEVDSQVFLVIDSEMENSVTVTNRQSKRRSSSIISSSKADLEKQNLSDRLNEALAQNQQLQHVNQGLQCKNLELHQENESLKQHSTTLQHEIQELQHGNLEFHHINEKLKNYSMGLRTHLDSVIDTNSNLNASIEQHHRDNSDLRQQYQDLERKFNKKVESYKKLDKDYMDLVRPILPTNDDNSTIYRRLMDIRVSIENLIQKARGPRSTNLNKEAAIEHFKKTKLLEGFPISEADLEPYHLDLYMESAMMSTLIDGFFSRPLDCIFDHSQEFLDVYKWIDERDGKTATRWRQQLCVLASQDTETMKRKREEEVIRAGLILSAMVSGVYTNVDLSEKINGLCYSAFDLSFAMFGMESRIYPVTTPLGVLFDDETMKTPHKSNPTGVVSLVIFPAFGDDSNTFFMEPKVWCY